MNFLPRILPNLMRGIKSIPVSCEALNSTSRLSLAILDGSSMRPFTRSLWYFTPHNQNSGGAGKLQHVESLSKTCSCGCSAAAVHTKGDKELLEFLEKEIADEKKAQKIQEHAVIKEYEIKSDGSDLTLTKKFKEEVIKINLNVNHTVDTDVPEVSTNPQQDNPGLGELKSKPTFSVEITKGKLTLAFSCSFTQQESQEEAEADPYRDVFNIDEVAVHDGEWKDTTYAVSGEIMDGNLYDLLMNLLEERGIDNEFVDTLSTYCTAYEHNSYIGLLQKIKDFAATQ